jgi:N-acyl-D-amino-acid deacylase
MTTRRHILSLAASAALPAVLRSEGAPAFEAPVSALIESFLKERGYPGAQLAVGREGRILLSKGFGMADREKNLPVQPRTLFRIASVSKPLTSAAIFTLIEAGKLTLDTKMLDVLKVDIFLPKGRQMDPRMKDITIRQLLQHTGGWDRDKSKGADVMFQDLRIAKTLGVPSPPSARNIIREVLGRPLDFDPGTRYVYSNFGFCILGRIVEDLTDTAYPDYVKEHVLKPAGISGPRLGATLTQVEGEARYYAVNKDGSPTMGPSVFPNLPDLVPAPYGTWYLEHMDSHGGWIAPAEDLVRFIMSLDDVGRTSPFSKRETLTAMLEPAPGAPGHDKNGKPLEVSYACGFRIIHGPNGVSFTHGGSLPGTSTTVMRRADGWCWAIFLNQRPGDNDPKSTLVDDVQKVFDGLKAGATS